MFIQRTKSVPSAGHCGLFYAAEGVKNTLAAYGFQAENILCLKTCGWKLL
jgi:hypothetical protein